MQEERAAIQEAGPGARAFFTRQARFFPAAAACLGHGIWGLSYLFTKVALGYASADVLLAVQFLLAFWG